MKGKPVKHPLRAFRLRDRIKTGELAKRLGIDASTLTRYETGKIAIPPERVLAIEGLTGIPRHALRPDVYGYGPPVSAKANAAG